MRRVWQILNKIFIHFGSNRVSTAQDRAAYVASANTFEGISIVNERARAQNGKCDDIFIASTMNLICEPL